MEKLTVLQVTILQISELLQEINTTQNPKLEKDVKD